MDFISHIFNAGVVGCGGAGFPTHVKLKSSPEYFIVNGAECEPLLRTDRYIMTELSDKVIEGMMLIMQALHVKKGYIALKAGYTEEIAALEAAIARAGADIKLHLMESFYPAGDEQVIVYEVTGRVVPAAGIPLDVGAVVDNVATVLAVSDAVKGIALTDKYVTVTGEVASPVVLHVPVGTAFTECIRQAGGTHLEDYIVVSGGPMMGKVLTKEEAAKAVVTKTTSGIIVLKTTSHIAANAAMDRRRMLAQAKSACIQCSYCTQMCPRHMLGHPLRPHMIMRKLAMADIENKAEILQDFDIRQAAICSECGICEVYACPMGLKPRQMNIMLKGMLRDAGIRYERAQDSYEAHPNRDNTKAPTKRTAARAGVLAYYDISIKNCKECVPDTVRIPMSMHIGAPSEMIVTEGEKVHKGQLIGRCPEGSLGANIHASISGTVHIDENTVIIMG